MKVGDLVTVHPACISKYIIVERLNYKGEDRSLWLIHDGEKPYRMTQRFMEVVSSSPHL